MENIGRTPTRDEARDALSGIEAAQRAVRDTPWPTWLYPTNAALLGALTLTPLLDEPREGIFLLLAFTVMVVNVRAGYRMGAPWALPTSRGFLAAVVASSLCVLAALVVADGTDRAWPVVTLAVAATALYLAGAVAHRRSTGSADARSA